MPKRLTPPPYPKKPHASGQARVKLFGKTHYLGAHGSPASHAAYERLLVRWREGTALRLKGIPVLPGDRPETVAELLAHFWIFAAEEYGEPVDAQLKADRVRLHRSDRDIELDLETFIAYLTNRPQQLKDASQRALVRRLVA